MINYVHAIDGGSVCHLTRLPMDSEKEVIHCLPQQVDDEIVLRLLNFFQIFVVIFCSLHCNKTYKRSFGCLQVILQIVIYIIIVETVIIKITATDITVSSLGVASGNYTCKKIKKFYFQEV